MINLAQSISFILNDKEVTASVSAGMLVLDYLRKEAHLCGTKEGCKEGDCGACSVILGSMAEGVVKYSPMTSCLMPMGELQGKHLVTIEGLNMGGLSPVQDAMVDCGGTQCGYCTPGFVVSMTAGLMEPRLPLDEDGMLYAISGNLCRCTGYRSIKEAGLRVIREVSDNLKGGDRILDLCEVGALPAYFKSIPRRLAELQLPAASSDASRDSLFIGGGTDLYVQQGEKIPESAVDLLNTREAVEPARIEGDQVVLDARMTFESFAQDPIVREQIPLVQEYNLLIASWPVRTRATLAGNICNASPIADMTCLLMALNAELTLSNCGRLRTVALRDFYLGYKELNKTPEEKLVSISFPILRPEERVNWEKVSKRSWLDIATVNAAVRIEVIGGIVQSATLALGGVAPIPLYLLKASQFLLGKSLSTETVVEVLQIAMDEISPISDVRGSADYKKLLARQLMLAHFQCLFAEKLEMEAVYAAL